MIVYASSVKADVKTSVIKMIDSSLPRKKEAVQKETTVVIEKERKLPYPMTSFISVYDYSPYVLETGSRRYTFGQSDFTQ